MNRACLRAFSTADTVRRLGDIGLSLIHICAFGHFGNNTAGSVVTNKEFSQEFNGVTTLDLDFSAGYLEIQKGDVFKVEGYNLPSNFTAEQKVDTLKIKDSIKDPVNFLNALSDSKKPHLTVTIPEGTAFKEVELAFGASDTSIDTLKTGRLKAVSYTHLDVYKRQPEYCAALQLPAAVPALETE